MKFLLACIVAAVALVLFAHGQDITDSPDTSDGLLGDLGNLTDTQKEVLVATGATLFVVGWIICGCCVVAILVGLVGGAFFAFKKGMFNKKTKEMSVNGDTTTYVLMEDEQQI